MADRRQRRRAVDLHRVGIVAVPAGFSRVSKAFAARGLHEQVTFIGAGKRAAGQRRGDIRPGLRHVNVGRGAMLAIGCIQAQNCHTDIGPTGAGTPNRWLARGLDPELKSVRLATTSRRCAGT
jgi:glutamate synthase domain-containing protein 2